MKSLVFVILGKWNYGFNDSIAIILINIQIQVCRIETASVENADAVLCYSGGGVYAKTEGIQFL